MEERPGLLIYVPSVKTKSQNDRYSDFLRMLSSEPELDGWSLRIFEHNIGIWSRANLKNSALQLAAQIRTWAGDAVSKEGPSKIILVGHSLGGLLAREAFLLDKGSDDDGIPSKQWTEKVNRIVLLASPNAGFRRESLPWHLGLLFAAAKMGPSRTAEQIESGSDFITDLRLRWFTLWTGQAPLPRVVQVLGTNDSLISASDVLDARFLPNTARMDVPGASHGDLVDLKSAADPECRYLLLRHSVLGDFPETEFSALSRHPGPVYFMLHGIRSSRYADWIQKVSDALTTTRDSTGQENANPVIYSPSNGFFSAAQFAVPAIRRKNMRHFLHWYGNYFVSHHPDNIHFAGHSNGTYMLGRALLQVPSVRFRRIYLAASVLPRDFPWSTVVDRNQVGHYLSRSDRQGGSTVTGVIHSDRGSKDVPVGWLCSALNGLGMRDVGTGGYDGFDQSIAALVDHPKSFDGGHGAAFAPNLPWPSFLSRFRRHEILEHNVALEAAGQARIEAIADFLRSGNSDMDVERAAPTRGTVEWFASVSRLAGVMSLPVAAGAGLLIARTLRSSSPSQVAKLSAGAFAVWAAARAL